MNQESNMSLLLAKTRNAEIDGHPTDVPISFSHQLSPQTDFKGQKVICERNEPPPNCEYHPHALFRRSAVIALAQCSRRRAEMNGVNSLAPGKPRSAGEGASQSAWQASISMSPSERKVINVYSASVYGAMLPYSAPTQ